MLPRNIKLLLVDDDKELLELLVVQFKAFGFQMLTATSGDEAVGLIEKMQPQIIVSDYRMKNGDGLKVLQYCKSRNVHHPKVFIISGYSDFSVEELYNEGADGFFSKPFSASELRTNVQRALMEKRQVWSRQPEKTERVFKIKGENLQTIIESGLIRFGRGGVFVQTQESDWQEGMNLNVELQFSQKNIEPLKLHGRVAWVRRVGNRPPGLGLEITYVSPQCFAQITAQTDRPSLKPFIPNV